MSSDYEKDTSAISDEGLELLQYKTSEQKEQEYALKQVGKLNVKK